MSEPQPHRHDREAAGVHADAPAEHLFFSQYRYWMAGFANRDMFCWDCAWDALQRFAPPDVAKTLYSEFHFFTRTLNQRAQRPIGWLPDLCRCLCRDEYWVLSLLVASQHMKAHDELLSAAELVDISDAPFLIAASRSLARALEAESFVFVPMIEPLRRTSAPGAAPQSATWH